MCCNQRRRQKYNFCFRLNCAHRATPYHYMAAMMITMMMLCLNEWIRFSVWLLFQTLKDIVSDFSLTTLSSAHIWGLRRFTFFVVASRCHCRHLLTLQHCVRVYVWVHICFGRFLIIYSSSSSYRLYGFVGSVSCETSGRGFQSESTN